MVARNDNKNAMPNPSDEIKAKLDIVEVIREYIPLKAAGFNFRANCPFHREKTPSFMVSPEKQIWHCFGCGKGGDVFSFVMEIESLTFIEVLRLLAKKAGVVLRSGADPALTSKRNVLLDIVELAAKFYHKILSDSPLAAAARAYLKERGLTDETIEAWQIGYSPEGWEHLANFLKGRGFGENEVFLAGLSVKKEKNPGFYDRFRGRIMFPINDINGNAVGFTARVSPEKEAEEKMGKYINTPATMIYEKSKILFGLDKAKLNIKREDLAIIMEGQMDVITAHQHGFTNTVASSGTALTADQINLIMRYTHNLNFSLDFDQAGQQATEKGDGVVKLVDYKEVVGEDSRGNLRKYIDPVLSYNANIKVITMLTGKDPDECIKDNPDEWRRAVAAAKPIMQFHFDKTFSGLNLKDYEGQSEAVKALLPIIAKLGSKLEQDFWLKKLSQEVDTNENLLREKFERIISASRKSAEPKWKAPAKPDKLELKPELNDRKQSREARLSELLLALGLKYPAHLEYIINHIAPEHLVGEDYRLFYKKLIIYYNKLIDFWTHEGGNFDLAINYQDFKDWLNNPEDIEQDNNDATKYQADNNQCASSLDRLVLLADKDFSDYTPEKAKAEIIAWMAVLKVNYLSERRHQVIKLIALAEKENLPPSEKSEKLKGLMEEFKALTEEINLAGLK